MTGVVVDYTAVVVVVAALLVVAAGCSGGLFSPIWVFPYRFVSYQLSSENPAGLLFSPNLIRQLCHLYTHWSPPRASGNCFPRLGSYQGCDWGNIIFY